MDLRNSGQAHSPATDCLLRGLFLVLDLEPPPVSAESRAVFALAEKSQKVESDPPMTAGTIS